MIQQTEGCRGISCFHFGGSDKWFTHASLKGFMHNIIAVQQRGEGRCLPYSPGLTSPIQCLASVHHDARGNEPHSSDDVVSAEGISLILVSNTSSGLRAAGPAQNNLSCMVGIGNSSLSLCPGMLLGLPSEGIEPSYFLCCHRRTPYAAV